MAFNMPDERKSNMKLREMIKEKKEFTVGFIGGSITEGAGATKPACRYSSVTLSLLAERYPDVTFREVNAGVGGTGSNLGLFRAESQLLSGEPDLVFVEFSVNDAYNYSSKYHESLVRFLRKCRSTLPIGFIYTLQDKMYAEYYAKGQLPPVAASLEPVAAAYGIPTFPVALAICRKMESVDRWGEFFVDNVHPTDLGHRTYAEFMADALECCDFEIKAPNEPLGAIVDGSPRMVPLPRDVDCSGWEVSDKPFANRFPSYIYSDKPGTELAFEFDGTAVGIYNTVERDSGIVEFSIDGGQWYTHSTWDKYALQYSRSHYRVMFDSLPEGHHTLRLRVSGEIPEQSEGRFIRIGAILVG